MEKKKIGIVVMFKIHSGGGAPRVIVDLIKSLNEKGHEVHLMTPWKVDLEKVSEIFEPIDIDKEYNLEDSSLKLCVEPNLSRKLMKSQFMEMQNEVDLIIDVDGGVLHNYLNDEKKYVIWRISGIISEKSEWERKNWKMALKTFIRSIITPDRNTLSKDHNIYAVDNWTRDGLIEDWKLKPQELCLYPEIKTEDFSDKRTKKNQVIILGRISPNKRLDESVRVFAKGARNSDYKLLIVGGVTPDSENYLNYLKNIAKEEGIGDKIEIVGNPSFDKLKEIVEESKILIECQRDISLTMTSIECLAAGVIVLVHRNGGTFKEVLDHGRFGIGFDNIEEGAKKLKETIEMLEDGRKVSGNLKARALFFSGDKFRERLDTILVENGI